MRHYLFIVVALQASVALGEGSAPYTAPVQSMKALRDANVVRQQFDYSCGAAALATLLTFGLNDAVDEATVLEAIARTPDTSALSLLALARYAEARGYRAQGFRVAAADIARLTRPVIVHVNRSGYPHFAVLKGIREGRAYLADPALGNLRMPMYQFLAMWADEAQRGVLLAVEPAEGDWPRRYALELPGEAN